MVARLMERVVVLGTVLLWTGPAHTQDKSTYYTVRHPDQFTIDWRAFYDKAEALTAEARRTLPHELDLPYGRHPKQRLDLYFPPSAATDARPVFVFIHGGGFREGDRAQYGFVARPFAARGIVTAVVSYRLTPEFIYPSQPEDIQLALSWLWKNVGARGGDPDRIFVGGHSAGAILAADVAVKTDWLSAMSLPANLIKGIVPVSGGYDLRKLKSVTNYVPDARAQEQGSPILHISGTGPPAVVAVGSGEPYVASSREMARRLRASGGRAELLVLQGLDHSQTVLALGDERSTLFTAVLNLIAPAESRSRGPRAP